MKAVDFVDLIKSYLQQKSTPFWSDSEIFINLNSAYIDMQKELLIHKDSEIIEGVEGVDRYSLLHKSIIPIKLYVDNEEYELISFAEFFNYRDNSFCVNLDRLYIYPASEDNGEEIKIIYAEIKELKNELDEITLPNYAHEALRFLTLAKLYEKHPNRDNKNQSIHYLNLYNRAINSDKKVYSKTQNKRTKTSRYINV